MGQNQVLQSGLVTPAHVASWTTDGVIQDSLISVANLNAAMFADVPAAITRASIALTSSTLLPDTFMTSGYAVGGDLGAGAIYTKNGATSGGILAIQTLDGVWYNLVFNGVLSIGWFGAVGDSVTDCTAAIQGAINAIPQSNPHMGGSVFIPAGWFKYTSTINVNKNSITIFGTGGSVLRAYNSAGFFIGDTGQTGGGQPQFNALFPRIIGVAFIADDNHNGDILTLDFTQNALVRDVTTGLFQNNGTTQTNGLRINSTQYTVVENYQSLVNGYNIYVYLGHYTSPSIPENEGHYSFSECFVYASKVLKAGTTPAGIAFERVAGRGGFSTCDQVTIENVHMGKFISGGSSPCSGILIKNEMSGFQTQTLKSVNIVGCMFEGLDYGWTVNLAGTLDTSTASFKDCYWLLNPVCIQGSDVTKSFYTIDTCIWLQCGTVGTKFAGFWTGFNQVNSSGQLWDPGGFIIYQKFANKEFKGAPGFSTVALNGGDFSFGDGVTTTFTINHGLTDQGTPMTPTYVAVTPTGPINAFVVNSINNTSFTVTFSIAPGGGSHLKWIAEVLST